MKIYYDGQMFCMQKTGGINRYFTELINRLPQSITPIVSISKKVSILYPNHSNLRTLQYPFANMIPQSFWNRLEQCYFSAQELLTSADLYHPTFYKALTKKRDLKNSAPMVVTVWDSLHKLFPAQLDPDGAWGEQIKRTIESADALLCISQSTKNDLLKYYKLKTKQIHVIHLASNLSSCDETIDADTKAEIQKSEYFLFVGARSGYKNFSKLLEAFSKISSNNKDIKLCIAGNELSEQETAQIHELKLQDNIKHFLHPRDGVLCELYRSSIALVYPSLYEGFGLPALEALNLGTTVIASNSSSLPEVVGNSGLLIDTSKVDQVVDAMQLLISNTSERERLKQSAKARASLFSWDKVADQTFAVYQSLLN